MREAELFVYYNYKKDYLYFHPIRSFIIFSIWEFEIQRPALFSSRAKRIASTNASRGILLIKSSIDKAD